MVKHRTSTSLDLTVDSFGHLSDSLLMLDEKAAVRLIFDEQNLRRLIHVLWILAAVNLLYGLTLLEGASTWRIAAAGGALLVDLWLLRCRRVHWMLSDVRGVTGAVLIGHLMVWQLFHADAEVLGGWFVLFAVLAARVRLSKGETGVLFGAMYTVVALRLVGESLLRKAGMPILEVVLYFCLVYLPLFGLSLWLSHRRESSFLARWRNEHDRNRDRLRMKQELEYAREIQLSMLPRQAPEFPWLDLAASSLPATEVGGDYYDYFPLDPDRLAVVLGDVTGHGVASGLVLSGVRSCLNLLQEELVRPAEVLAKVNTMVKRTSTSRMLMTLAIVVVDTEKRELCVATAGHPPVLMASAGDEEVREVGMGSFPLGAVEGTSYETLRIALHSQDVLVLYSDGIVEAMNEAGELFGWQRLKESLRAATGCENSAAGIRDAILAELGDYVGEEEQQDDVTMVVIRCADCDS